MAGGEFDDLLLLKIEAAEAVIDLVCGRSFGAPVTEARTYTATSPIAVLTDDYASVPTSVEGAEAGALTYLTDWSPMRHPHPARGWPGFGIELEAAMLTTGERVEIAADWGWAAVPASVKEAATLYAVRLFNRADSPMGLQVGDMGAAYIARSDPDVISLLGPFCGRGKL